MAIFIRKFIPSISEKHHKIVLFSGTFSNEKQHIAYH